MLDTLELFTLFVIALAIVGKPLGLWFLPLAQGRAPDCVATADRWLLKAFGLRPDAQENWRDYALSVLLFHVLAYVFLVTVLLLQGHLPGNPDALPGVPFVTALHTAASFISSTAWQAYSPETTLSLFSQAIGIGVAQFVSTASGIAVAFVVMRGFALSATNVLGNFWVDLLRILLWVLFPLCTLYALFLLLMGVPQAWIGSVEVVNAVGREASQLIGPVASSEAVKTIGTIGAGLFGANSAHPLASPSAGVNFAASVGMLAIPVALVHTFAKLTGDAREGRSLLWAMWIVFAIALFSFVHDEITAGNFLAQYGIDARGFMTEGKDSRFGLAHTALFTVTSIASGTGAVNNLLDTLAPGAGMVLLLLMLTGGVFGSAGAGFISLVVYVVLAVFIAGLMIGRAPEYLGKRLGVSSIKLAALATLVVPVVALTGLIVTLLMPIAQEAVANPGAHGYTEILYAWSSVASNSGSAMAGLDTSSPFFEIGLGIAMLAGRAGSLGFLLALAGDVGLERRTPHSKGSLVTSGPLFAVFLACVILLFGALTYLPLMALGSAAEQLEYFVL